MSDAFFITMGSDTEEQTTSDQPQVAWIIKPISGLAKL